MKKGVKKTLKILGASVLVFFVFTLCLGIFNGHQMSNTTTNRSKNNTITQQAAWAMWDGESEVPNAKLIVTLEKNAPIKCSYSYCSMEVSGQVYNNTSSKLSYVQVSIGVYKNGVKVGSCFDNTSYLSPQNTWAFNANCFDVPRDELSYKIEDIAAW